MEREDVDALITAIGGVTRALEKVVKELREIRKSLLADEEQPSQ